MGRTILAVIAGYFALAVAVMIEQFIIMAVNPDAYTTAAGIAIILFFDFIASAIGGYVTAWIAKTHEMKHAWYLVAVGILMAIPSFFMEQEAGVPLVYIILRTILFVPGVIVGAKLRIKQNLPPVW